MRILYGVHTQGQGGLSKASVLVPLMESHGHEVRVISSGASLPGCYRFRWHSHLPGMDYVVANGKTDYVRTFVRWLHDSPRILRTVWHVRKLVREFQPDLILSDYEPLTASPLVEPKCEVFAVSRPAALLDPAIPLPDDMRFERRLTKTAIRLVTCGAHRRLGYHLEPASYRCLPPVIDDAVRNFRPSDGDYLLVYNAYHTQTDNGSADDLVAWARSARRPVIAYGYREVRPPERRGFVEFRRPERQQFLQDLASARAVITTAGLSLPLEAFLLGKPLCVVPIPGQWEQIVNAFHLEHAGLGSWLKRWDYDLALETPAPATHHPLNSWLNTPPAAIVSRILGEPAIVPADRHRIAA